MKRKFPFALFLLAAAMVAISGCSQPPEVPSDGTQQGEPQGGLKPAETAVPAQCAGLKGDVCALFECTIEQCWCDTGIMPSAILSGGKGPISDAQGAIDAVSGYLQGKDSEYADVRRAVKLNAVFWNVFAYNSEGDEETFTVAADGAIIKTACGV